MSFSGISTPMADEVLTLVKPYLNTMYVGLFKNPTLPSLPYVLSSWAQPTFTSYAMQPLSFTGSPTGPAGARYLVADRLNWLADPLDPQEFIYGYFGYDPATGLVVWFVSPTNAPQPAVTGTIPFSILVQFGMSYALFP